MRAVENSILRPRSKLIEKGILRYQLPVVQAARRRMLRGLPIRVPGYVAFCNDTHDNHTMLNALTARLLRDVPEPDMNLISEFGKFTQHWLDRHLPHGLPPWSYDRWRSSLDMNHVQLSQFDAAHDLLEFQGGLPTRKQCEDVTTFAKTESYYPKPKHNRLINSPSQVFKVFTGPMVKAVEEVLYELPYFVKHMTSAQRARKVASFDQPGWHYYVTDFSAFEASLGPAFMEVCECLLYKHVLGDNAATQVLNYTITHKRKLRTRGRFYAESYGRRMSGDTCTSCGNGFSNLMLNLFIAEKTRNEIRCLVEGDDGMIAARNPVFSDLYTRLGFDIKLVEVESACTALSIVDGAPQPFCGLLVSSDMQIIREPGKTICSLTWTHSFIDGSLLLMRRLQRAKALCCLFETPDCPIISVLAHYILDCTAGVKPRHVYDGYHIVPNEEWPVPAFAPTNATRCLFERAYNVPVAMQLAIERAISNGNFDAVAALLPPPTSLISYAATYVSI